MVSHQWVTAPGLSATLEPCSPKGRALYIASVITYCPHLCMPVPVSIAHVQWASRLGSGEDPGHGTSIFPIGLCGEFVLYVQEQDPDQRNIDGRRINEVTDSI